MEQQRQCARKAQEHLESFWIFQTLAKKRANSVFLGGREMDSIHSQDFLGHFPEWPGFVGWRALIFPGSWSVHGPVSSRVGWVPVTAAGPPHPLNTPSSGAFIISLNKPAYKNTLSSPAEGGGFHCSLSWGSTVPGEALPASSPQVRCQCTALLKTKAPRAHLKFTWQIFSLNRMNGYAYGKHDIRTCTYMNKAQSLVNSIVCPHDGEGVLMKGMHR